MLLFDVASCAAVIYCAGITNELIQNLTINSETNEQNNVYDPYGPARHDLPCKRRLRSVINCWYLFFRFELLLFLLSFRIFYSHSKSTWRHSAWRHPQNCKKVVHRAATYTAYLLLRLLHNVCQMFDSDQPVMPREPMPEFVPTEEWQTVLDGQVSWSTTIHFFCICCSVVSALFFELCVDIW